MAEGQHLTEEYQLHEEEDPTHHFNTDEMEEHEIPAFAALAWVNAITQELN